MKSLYLYSAQEDVRRTLRSDNIPPEEFLKLTEQRSSILIRVGFVTDDHTGKLHEIYEFQHLTFQEYLTALAVKKKYYPNASRGDRAIDILTNPDGLNAFDPEHMKNEVILLTSSLINWDAEDIALYLTEQRQINRDARLERFDLLWIGVDLLLDEIALEQDTLYRLMLAIGKTGFLRYCFSMIVC